MAGYNPSFEEAALTIHLLPEEVASAIAAGEVVERPASVVKELVENALDAGARSIDIQVERGGRERITVADDGCGIDPDEVVLALARHATSKLETTQDLFAIRTLGFRGEALASIAAVSHLEITSRIELAEAGVQLISEPGVTGTPGPVGAPVGTQVQVRNLFFNVPARLKFLKSEDNERRRTLGLVTRYALAYPQVRFELVQEGRRVFQSTGSGEPREVLAAMFGLELARQVLSLPATEARGIRVAGFISPPSIQRSSRREITLFINGRWVQDSSLAAAVVQAYHGLLMVGRFPLAVVFLTLPPEDVDVNVHPAKAEVRLREPELVFSVLQRVVRSTLLGQAAPPSLDLPAGWGERPWGQGGQAVSPGWLIAHPSESAPLMTAPAQRTLAAAGVPLLRAVGQVGAAYLVAEGPDGLYLIDQHAAHERVLFETLMAAERAGVRESQGLLEPVTVELSPAQSIALEPQLGVLQHLGFEIEPFGRGAFRVRALPALLANLQPEAALLAVVEEFEEDEAPLEAETEARLAARVCKRAAVKAGQVLSLVEQEQLLRDLEACASPRTCPHGRPTMIHLSVESLERQFGRRG
jgi:DNA mismatch repair protein MutL